MAVKASTTVTITAYRDTKSVTRYYKLVSATVSAPSKPTANPPDGWTDTEPSYTSGSTSILYFCDLTIFSDDKWAYSAVSKSSSYEAAKEAYNKAQNAQSSIDNLEIGGRNILLRTKDFSSEWLLTGTSTPVTDDDGFGYCGLINTWTNYIKQYSVPIELNEVYSFSFYAKADAAVNLEIKDDSNNNQVLKVVVINSTEWKRYTGIFTRTVNIYSTSHVAFLTRQANTTIYIKKIKIEKGNKATDWTPAPEDVDAGISNAQTTADNAQATADEVADITDGKLDISDYDSDKAVFDSTIGNINTEIDSIHETTDDLSKGLSNELVAKGYAKITSEPSLELGRGESDWKVKITNESVDLQKSGSSGARLAPNPERENETLFRTDSTRLANLYFRSAGGQGRLGIVAQSNGHISLKEI